MTNPGMKMVAREGAAPSNAVCKTAVILFHQRALEWWTARVTLPAPRIKSPVHHYNACSPKLVPAAGVAPAHDGVLDAVPLLLGYAGMENGASGRNAEREAPLRQVAERQFA